MIPLTVDCHIYRSKHKNGLYVYLREKDNFDFIPGDLKSRLGTLEFSFSTNLTETKKLARVVDTKQAIKQVQENGFFLQMPPANTNFLDLNLNQSGGF